ncbi:MAG: hypothetical protein A2Y41_00120 [Spirochaetes bacterium GWB1_36_13]|nr:MAG: hypothetical protein A2Y41_00120 [Spirochaetes bacterium GWB1_36_13]
MQKYGIFFILLLLFSLGSFIQSKPFSSWRGYDILITPSRGDFGQDDYQDGSLKFIHKKTKKTAYTYNLAIFKIIDLQTQKINRQDALIAITSSGGESGGFLTVLTFTIENEVIVSNREIDFSGYSNIVFQDVDQDGNQEMLSDSLRFHNMEIGSISLPIAAVIGGSSLYYPQIYAFTGYEWVKKPISKTIQKYFQKYFMETEKLLKKYQGKTLDNQKEMDHNFLLFNFLEYYYNLSKLNEESRALINIRQSKIRLACQDGKTIFLEGWIENNKALIFKSE